jgi:hypothetical protein
MKDKMVSEIVGKIKKDRGVESESVSEEEEDYSEDMGLESAAGEILSAIVDEDASGLMDALKSFVQMCKDDESKGE